MYNDYDIKIIMKILYKSELRKITYIYNVIFQAILRDITLRIVK